MITFTIHVYNPDRYLHSVEVIRNDTGGVISSRYGPNMTHERALEIARDEVRLHTSVNGERVPSIVDHWDCRLLCGIFPNVHGTESTKDNGN